MNYLITEMFEYQSFKTTHQLKTYIEELISGYRKH